MKNPTPWAAASSFEAARFEPPAFEATCFEATRARKDDSRTRARGQRGEPTRSAGQVFGKADDYNSYQKECQASAAPGAYLRPAASRSIWTRSVRSQVNS